MVVAANDSHLEADSEFVVVWVGLSAIVGELVGFRERFIWGLNIGVFAGVKVGLDILFTVGTAAEIGEGVAAIADMGCEKGVVAGIAVIAGAGDEARAEAGIGVLAVIVVTVELLVEERVVETGVEVDVGVLLSVASGLSQSFDIES